MLSGLALDGKHFFYINPLLSRGGYARQPQYGVACFPTNLMRLLASLGQYFATRDETGLQIHLYINATLQTGLASGRPLTLSLSTHYPWHGQVRLSVGEADGSAWSLRLRVPEWGQSAVVNINGCAVEKPAVESGYLVLEKALQAGDVVELALSMDQILVEAHPRLDAVRGSLAIQRGPLVYCLEAVDHPGLILMDVQPNETNYVLQLWRRAKGLPSVRSTCCGLRAQRAK